jgi:hypothetical protein
MTINKVIIIGNLGQDPEIRKTQDGREIANFSTGRHLKISGLINLVAKKKKELLSGIKYRYFLKA